MNHRFFELGNYSIGIKEWRAVRLFFYLLPAVAVVVAAIFYAIAQIQYWKFYQVFSLNFNWTKFFWFLLWIYSCAYNWPIERANSFKWAIKPEPNFIYRIVTCLCTVLRAYTHMSNTQNLINWYIRQFELSSLFHVKTQKKYGRETGIMMHQQLTKLEKQNKKITSKIKYKTTTNSNIYIHEKWKHASPLDFLLRFL